MTTSLDATELARQLDRDDLASLIDGVIVSAVPLAGFRPITSERVAFRVDLADGRRVKLRRLKAGTSGGRIAELLRPTVPGDFSRVLAWRDQLVVEEWVDGTSLDRTEASVDRIRRAGQLLGRLHSTSLKEAATVSTVDDRVAFVRHLEYLQRAALVDIAEVSRIRVMIDRADPIETARGVTHGDFSAENIVLAAGDRLCAIDNEDMAVGPVDGDLIRSEERWPMAPAERTAFLDGYRQFRDPAAAFHARAFWAARSRALSARVRTLAGDTRTAMAHARELVAIADAPQDSPDA